MSLTECVPADIQVVVAWVLGALLGLVNALAWCQWAWWVPGMHCKYRVYVCRRCRDTREPCDASVVITPHHVPPEKMQEFASAFSVGPGGCTCVVMA